MLTKYDSEYTTVIFMILKTQKIIAIKVIFFLTQSTTYDEPPI